jgi:hypothetical protein
VPIPWPSIPRDGSSSATAPTTAPRSFDQDGKFLDEWKQFSRPGGIFIDSHDTIYVTDSESTDKEGYGHNPGWKRGSAKDGKVTAFIPGPFARNGITSAAGGVAADSHANVYGAKSVPRT